MIVLKEHGALASGAAYDEDADLLTNFKEDKEVSCDYGWKFVLDLLSKGEISQRSLPEVLKDAEL